MKSLFRMGGELEGGNAFVISVLGVILFGLLWQMSISFGLIEARLLPSPISIVSAVPDLVSKYHLVPNLLYSLKLNLMGYGVALLFAVPLGFLLGLSPLARGIAMPLTLGFPYLPLSATTMVFIMWFGIEDTMKVSFLAFAIFVYLLPIITARVLETRSVYINTAKTLGASKLQMIMKIYVPDTLSRVWDDVVVLVAISWTYIIIVEMINRSAGGIGAMMFLGERLHRPEITFALLVILMFVGYCQNRIFRFIGDLFFPHKKVR